jgi:DNA-binding NtrC family response regulator
MATKRFRSAGSAPSRGRNGSGDRDLPPFLTADARVRDTLRLLDQVADTRAPVLILGETGTGKEIIARRLHALSSRSQRSFIALNCGAVPQGLRESELFGHERGSFTGATGTRHGAFESAQGGTLFLDELAESSKSLQVALLRALQSGEISRVGSSITRDIDVRIVSASNVPLEPLIKAASFRLDLYYRLNVVRLELPPLRERPADVPLLAEYFLERSCQVYSRHLVLSDAVLAALSRYAFPGNVRELENIIHRAVIVGRGSAIEIGDLPAEVRPDGPESDPPTAANGSHTNGAGTYIESRDRMLEKFDHAFIAARLRETAGNVAMAARRAGLSERSFHLKMRKLRIRRGEFRPGGTTND